MNNRDEVIRIQKELQDRRDLYVLIKQKHHEIAERLAHEHNQAVDIFAMMRLESVRLQNGESFLCVYSCAQADWRFVPVVYAQRQYILDAIARTCGGLSNYLTDLFIVPRFLPYMAPAYKDIQPEVADA
ncbi:MAG: hypothetical protein KJS91_18020 [Planctomycetes bacterium]|nr:hypothetical protein [Planctomycetota bacterium]